MHDTALQYPDVEMLTQLVQSLQAGRPAVTVKSDLARTLQRHTQARRTAE
jgi:hypothetical protein